MNWLLELINIFFKSGNQKPVITEYSGKTQETKMPNHVITLELLQKLCPTTKKEVLEAYVQPLNEYCEQANILDTKTRLAAFLAQIIHESGGFKIIKENLNYSSHGLQKTFKKYFPTEKDAQLYARNPERIANKVYANRMGNSDENSGDGWKFRGRGLIQLTGKTHYTRFSEHIKKTLDQTVTYLETTEGAVRSACWFWNNNQLNKLCDENDFIGLTKRINGGTNGLKDREKYFELALKEIK